MNTSPSPSFGVLLRQYRRTAGLTQEELAERAGLGRATIDSLERGTRQAPRKETVALLAEALQLSEGERTLLEAAARGHRRDSQLAFTPLASSEPPLASAVASRTPVEAVPPPASQATGKPAARLLTRKRAAGLLSGLLAVALLGGVLFLKGEPGVVAFSGLQPRTLCLATDFPTTAQDAHFGKPDEHAVNLAVNQNQSLGNGYTLQVINYDDVLASVGRHDPNQGAKNVADIVKNPCIVGLVGPINSSVAQAEMPIAANAGLVMISPSNTNPGLTLRPYGADVQGEFDQLHPPGKPINYFRIIANDAFQGLVDADFTWNTPPDGLGARSAYVVEDTSPYGLDLVGGFTKAYLARGGQIVGTDRIPFGGIPQLAELAARILATRPEVVFYGGVTGEPNHLALGGGGGLLKAQLTKVGYTGLFVGGDAIAGNPSFIVQAGGSAATDIFATVATPDLSTFTSGAAAQFLSDYHAAYGQQPDDGYSPFAYDAAMILITAIKHLIKTGQPVTRAAMIEQVQHIQYTGVTVPIRFDANGDIAHGLFSLYAVQDGQWVWVKQMTM